MQLDYDDSIEGARPVWALDDVSDRRPVHVKHAPASARAIAAARLAKGIVLAALVALGALVTWAVRG